MQERRSSFALPICVKNWGKEKNDCLGNAFAADVFHALLMVLRPSVVCSGQLPSASISVSVAEGFCLEDDSTLPQQAISTKEFSAPREALNQ
jgi:hypothetical protein